MEQDVILHQIEQCHGYLQFVARCHLTWFAFHFTANATGLGYYKDHRIPYLRDLFLYSNVLAGIGSGLVVVYYFGGTGQVETLLSKLSATNAFGSPLPLWLWTTVASIIGFLCFAFAYGWYYAPSVSWREDEERENGEKSDQDAPSRPESVPQVS